MHPWLECTHTKHGHCSHLLEENTRNPEIKALPSLLEQGSLWDRRDAQSKTHFSPWLPLPLTSSLQDFLFPSFPKRQGSFQAQTKQPHMGFVTGSSAACPGEALPWLQGKKKFRSSEKAELMEVLN